MVATSVPDTGHGFSVSFGTTAWTGWLRSLPSNLKLARPRVNTTHAASASTQKYMPGDLDDHEEIELEVLFDSVKALPARGSADETITITLPLPAGGAAAAATIAGTGFITSVEYPSLVTNEVQIGKIRFSWSGATGPTWTAAS